VISCYLAVAHATPRRSGLEINDPDGNCWICEPTAPCRPCGANLTPIPNLAPFDPTCPRPTCSVANMNMTWPVNNDPTKFWMCNGVNGQLVPVQLDCQCGTYYYWNRQRCEFPWDTPVLCDDVIKNPPVKPPRNCENIPTPIVPQFNDACPVPDCTNPANLNFLYPVRDDPTKFIQCGSLNNVGAPITLDCQCGTYFNWYTQRCEHPWHTTE
jgi:hypothetical protein